MSCRFFKHTLLSLGLLWAGISAQANLNELQENSPFLPPDYKPRGSGPIGKGGNATPSRRLELTGMIEIGGVWSFSFYEPGKKRSFWAKMGDPKAEVRILDFNPVQKTVTVDAGGGREVVALKNAAPPTGALLNKASGLTGAAIGGGAGGAGRKPDNPDTLPPLTPEDEAALKMLEELLMGIGAGGPPPPPPNPGNRPK